MHTTTLLSNTLLLLPSLTAAAYTLSDNYDHTNFFTSFTFFSDPDPTNGFVNYKSAIAANNSALAGYTADNAIYLGVDFDTASPPNPGRPSVRVHSTKSYTRGLFIADIAHMPAATCGSWPAFWTVGKNWPFDGEIDILEGVNGQKTNAITLHTSPGCKMESTGSKRTSKLENANCNSNNAFNGCGFETSDERGYGDGFNAIGGGVYALHWTSSAIQIFFFPRDAIPADISSGQPDPGSSAWGEPTASFSGKGCDIDEHFRDHSIVFDTTFCGQWAGRVWGESECARLADTCEGFVAENPGLFRDAYWVVNGVRVYEESGGTVRRGRGLDGVGRFS